MKNQQGLQGAKRLFFMQLRLSVCIFFVVWMSFDLNSARSTLLGSLVWLIPQAWFALVLFREQRARFSQQIVKRAYRGEAGLDSTDGPQVGGACVLGRRSTLHN